MSFRDLPPGGGFDGPGHPPSRRVPRPSGGVYRSSTSGSSGTVYGGGTTPPGRNSGGTVYGGGGSGAQPGARPATTYGRPAGTTYGSSASGAVAAPSGLPARRQAFLDEQDRLTPEVGGEGPSKPKNAKATRKKWLKIGGLGVAIVMMLGLAVSGVAYAVVDLPVIPPNPQATNVFYDDGKNAFATFAAENRTDVKLAKVPEYVQNAVIAAEDASFWDNDEGVSITGTGRAILGLVKGEDAGGGSTITQQYVRNALNLTKERSYSRKGKEIILAQKMARSKSKKEILEAYLNTIYYGRLASGIQAASNAYFGVPVEKLTIAQGVVLAGVIKDPTNFDPQVKPASAEGRWNYILDRMVDKGFLSSTDRAKQTFPKTIDRNKKSGGWRDYANGVLAGKIASELEALGFDEKDVNTAGYRIVTTINRGAQLNAQKAARKYLKGQSTKTKLMGTAMVSVEPGSGKVKAYYGGEAGFGNFDLAKSPHPAGSSFKPYVLAAGVKAGYSIDSLWDGTSGQKLPGRNNPLRNSENDNSCGKQCSLTSATVKSLNTVYWALADKVGAKDVAKLANDAGIKTLNGEPTLTAKVDQSIGIGQPAISVLDQAAGYATIANYGTYHEPYFIEKILDSDGENVLWDHNDHVESGVQAFDESVGKDVSYVLQQVYRASKKKLEDGRPAAGKTGTQQLGNTDENSHAWMCGFTPQLATAVWVGSKSNDFALRDRVNGGGRVYGSGIPQSIWRQFMADTLDGAKKIRFQDPLHAGGKTGNAPSPEPPPEPTEEPEKPDDQPDDGDNPGDGQETPDPSQSPTFEFPNPLDPNNGNNNGNDGNNN